jgi:hypothetical protein
LRVRPLAACLATIFAVHGAGGSEIDALAGAGLPFHADQTAAPGGLRYAPALQKRPPAHPDAILAVTSCADDGSAGTLRSVVSGAHDNDEIDLSQLACNKINLDLQFGSIVISVDFLVILGRDQTVYGSGQDRVFLDTGVSNLSLINLNVSGGRYLGPGGCIYSIGNVYLSGSKVSGCSGFDKGGGVYTASYLTLTGNAFVGSSITGNSLGQHGSTRAAGGGAYAKGGLYMKFSTISDNTVTSVGGVLGVGGGAVAGSSGIHIVDSTISGNVAGIGGGLAGGGPQVSIRESTISGNTASQVGGVYLHTDQLFLENSTIAFNRTTSADLIPCNGAAGMCIGSLTVNSPSLDFKSTIIANNTNTAVATNSADLYVNFPISGAHNLVISSIASLPPDTLNADPQLGPLANNGGVTLTHALARTSPAVDKGSNFDQDETDQRNAPRVSGPAADIGAYELQVNDLIFADGFD